MKVNPTKNRLDLTASMVNQMTKQSITLQTIRQTQRNSTENLIQFFLYKKQKNLIQFNSTSTVLIQLYCKIYS